MQDFDQDAGNDNVAGDSNLDDLFDDLFEMSGGADLLPEKPEPLDDEEFFRVTKTLEQLETGETPNDLEEDILESDLTYLQAHDRGVWDLVKPALHPLICADIELQATRRDESPCSIIWTRIISAAPIFANHMVQIIHETEDHEGWNEPLVLLGLMVGDPGSYKSQLIKPLIRGADTIDIELRVDEFQRNMSNYTPTKKSKGDSEEETTERYAPIERRFTAFPGSFEKLFDVLARSSVYRDGIGMFCDEAAVFLGSMNKYSVGANDDRALLLQLWNGGMVARDTIKHGVQHVAATRFSFLGGIQPDVLKDFFPKDGKKDGWNSRFIFVPMFSKPSRKSIRGNRSSPVKKRQVDHFIQGMWTEYNSFLERMGVPKIYADHECPKDLREKADKRQFKVRFTHQPGKDDAEGVFDDFLNATTDVNVWENFTNDVKNERLKNQAHVARVAGVLWAIEYFGFGEEPSEDVEERHVIAAIELCRMSMTNWEIFQSTNFGDFVPRREDEAIADDVLSLIEFFVSTHKPAKFSPADMHRLIPTRSRVFKKPTLIAGIKRYAKLKGLKIEKKRKDSITCICRE